MKRVTKHCARFMSILFAIAAASSVFANPAPKAGGENPNFNGFVPPAVKFTGEKVSDADLTKIVKAGTSVPNEDNSWHFSVVTNSKVLAKIDEAVKNPPAMKEPKTGEAVPVPKDPTVKKQGSKKAAAKPDAKFDNKSDKNPPKDFNGFENGKAPDGQLFPNNGPQHNAEDLKKAVENGINGAPVVIIVSNDFMSGMGSAYAVQCMTKKAMELGYFVQVLNPIVARGLNEADLKASVKTPEGMPVGAVLLIGKAEMPEKPANFDENRPEPPAGKERVKAKEPVTYVK